MLDRVKPSRVHADELGVGREQRPRTRGEVLEPRPDREYDVCLTHDLVRRCCAGHAERTRIARVARQQR